MNSRFIKFKTISVGDHVVTPYYIFGVTAQQCYTVLEICEHNYTYEIVDNYDHRVNVSQGKFFLAEDFFALSLMLVLEKLGLNS